MAQFREASWEDALKRAADGFMKIKQRYGVGALGGFGTAKGSNEEGYLFQKLVRTGFGTNSVDHCARLCHSSSVVALIDQIGSGAAMAAYTQIENADVALVVGVNPSRGFPVAASIFKCAARQQGVKLIVVDPRRSEFAEHADIVITHRPGTDIALFDAMAYVLITEDLCDEPFLKTRVKGFEDFRSSVQPYAPEAVAGTCGVPADLISRCCAGLWFRPRRDHAVGHGDHPAYSWRAQRPLSLVNLALLTGNIGRPGTGPHPMRARTMFRA